MPTSSIVRMKSLGSAGTRCTTVVPVSALYLIVPVSGILLELLVGTYQHHREANTVVHTHPAYAL